MTVTAKAEQTGYRVFGPLVQGFDQVMASYSPAELVLVQQFLEQITAAVQAARAPTTD